MEPGTELVVRHGRRSDLPALVGLAGSADRAEWRLRGAEAGDQTLLVAVHDGGVVGAVSLRWHGSCDRPHPWLYGLHVQPDARRHGLGALLVRAAETVASLGGARAVSLDVDDDDPRLVAYYERLGYRVVTPHRHHWRSLDAATGLVTAEGVADCLLLRHELDGRHRGAAGGEPGAGDDATRKTRGRRGGAAAD
jgi:ribosomal protein S18 acetylase RimI-like enzyme